MQSFFGLIMLASIVLFVAGMFKPTAVIRWGAVEKKTRKKAALTYIGLFIFSFIALGIVTPTTNTNTSQTSQAQQEAAEQNSPAAPTTPTTNTNASQTSQAQQEAAEQNSPAAPTNTPPPLDPKQQLEKVVTAATGDKLQKVDISTGDDGKLIVEVQITGNENLTTNLTRKTICTQGANLFEKIYTSGFPVSKVSEEIYLPCVDKYGNTSNDVVVRMVLTEETAAKINWEGVNKLKFNDVADESWIHPGLYK